MMLQTASTRTISIKSAVFTVCALAALVLLAVFLRWLESMMMDNAPRHVRVVQSTPKIELNVSNPLIFLRQHLSEALKINPNGLQTDAISHDQWVIISNGESSVEFLATLIDGTCTSQKYCYIHLNGRDMTRSDAVESTKAILALLNGDSETLSAWVAGRSGRNYLGDLYEEQISTGHPVSYSLAIRSSFDIDGSDPWQVQFTIHLNEPSEIEPGPPVVPK